MLLLIKTLLGLRMVALRRGLFALGRWYLLLSVGLVIWAFFRLAALQNPQVWLFAAAVIIGGVHLSRNDRFFLQTLTPQWAWLMRTEYALLALPFMAGITAWMYWQGIAVLLVFVWLLPYARKPTFIYGQAVHKRRLLPAHMYEWQAGMRKNSWILGGIWILAVLFYWALIAQIAFLLLYWLIIGSFYLECEPRIWLDLQNAADSHRFLRQKIKNAVAAAVVGSMPFCVLIGVFHAPQAWLIVPLLLLMSAYVGYAVCLKYALYSEGRSLEPFMLHHLIFVGSCAVLPLLPVAVYWGWSNYGKARRNLSDLFSHA